MDLVKLKADCEAARVLAMAAAAKSDDGGTANLDSTFLPLPKGVRFKPVMAAVQSAGLAATLTHWMGRGLFISACSGGQGNRNYEANEALSESLRSAGWGVITYYQMD